jgi:hypothetical protein
MDSGGKKMNPSEKTKQELEIKVLREWLADKLLDIENSRFRYAAYVESFVELFYNQYCILSTEPFYRKPFAASTGLCSIDGWSSFGEIKDAGNYHGEALHIPYNKKYRVISKKQAAKLRS